jgi:hypothetical protein
MNLSLFGGTLQKSPEAYKLKHPNGAQFVFMHHWVLFMDVPC